jgi:hypothetical protein
MDNDYKIKLEVRGRISEFGADSVAELFYLFSTELFHLDVLTTPANTQSAEDIAAKKLMEQYCQQFSENRRGTPIFRAGLEVDVAKCYFARMTADKTIEWLKKERGFKTSISAVGRYFARFEQLPAGIR